MYESQQPLQEMVPDFKRPSGTSCARVHFVSGRFDSPGRPGGEATQFLVISYEHKSQT